MRYNTALARFGDNPAPSYLRDFSFHPIFDGMILHKWHEEKIVRNILHHKYSLNELNSTDTNLLPIF